MGRRDTSWPPAPQALPVQVVDNHTHLDAVLAETDDAGWRARADGDGAAGGAGAGGDAGGDGDGDGDVDADADADAAERAAIVRHLTDAAAVGVTRLVQVGCDLDALVWTDRVVRAHPELLGAVAIHPNEAVLHAGVHEVAPDGLDPHPRPRHVVGLDEAVARMAAVAAGNPRVRVIGETGLDHFRAGDQGRAVQREAFRTHIALAKELDLVLQIHDRDAHRDVLDVLAADGAPRRTVFHCFSGDAEMARLCAERGWYLSFAGPVTFGANNGLRAALHEVPLDRLLLETDAPYLTPHPYRGRPNAPAMVALTARAVSAELDLDLADLCATVAGTSEDLYGPW